MANVTSKVATIRNATYGNEVREGIASGIEAINTEVGTYKTDEVTRTTEFNTIKTDYDTYKNVMIAESNEAELQNNININSASLVDIALNVKSFDTIQEAINQAQLTTGTLLFPSGTYNVSNLIINPAKPLTIIGVGQTKTIIESSITPFTISQYDIDAIATTTITTDIKYGDKEINVINSYGFIKGQLVYISSTENMPETSVSSKRQYVSFIDEVSSGKLKLKDNAPQSMHLTSNTITIKAFNHAPIIFEDMTISVDRSILVNACFKLQYVANFTLNNVEMKDRNESTERNPAFAGTGLILHGITAYRCANIKLNNPYMNHLIYGVLAHEGTNNLEINSALAYYCRHTENVGLGAYNSKLYNCKAISCYAGFDAHDTSIDITLINCESSGGVIPSKLRGRRKILRDCILKDGLWSTCDTTVFNEIPFETSEGVSLGTWLFNTNLTDCDNRRTLLDGYSLQISGGTWIDITLFSKSIKVLNVENLLYLGINTQQNSDKNLFVDAPFTTITNCVAYGATKDIISIADETANIIFLYHTNNPNNKVAFEKNYINGFRSGYWLGTNGDYPQTVIKNNEIINSSFGVRVLNSSVTTISDMDKMKFSGNYQNFLPDKLFTSKSPAKILPRGLEINNYSVAPSAMVGISQIYRDSSDGNIKIIFADSTIKTFTIV